MSQQCMQQQQANNSTDAIAITNLRPYNLAGPSAARFFSSSPDDASTDEGADLPPPTYTLTRRSGVRNVAIVAHVDHGKTTLVDELLKSTSSEGGNRLMDSGDLEKERGITITSKVTRMEYDGNIINVVDTPGHADFAGEVDRILGMVDGVCLVVDASEGPMAQTKYVLSRALHQGLLPIVLLNKADRSDAQSKLESGETESQLLDLFDNLGATDEQMDYVTLYASAREGWVTEDPAVALRLAANDDTVDKESVSMGLLLNSILENIPKPIVHCYNDDTVTENESRDGDAFVGDKFSMAATTVGFDQYQGRTCTGRIYSGSITTGDSVVVLKRGDIGAAPSPPTTLAAVCVNRGILRTPLDPPLAMAGDIVTLVGVPDSIAVGDTVTIKDNAVPVPIQTPPLAPPTLCMDFGANNGPLAGQEGTIVTSSRIRSRLIGETDNNVTINVTLCETDSEKTTVFGRGELQLGILIEQMRREGFEMIVSPPNILTKVVDGVKMEPFEEVTVDVDTEFSGTVIDSLTGDRKGLMMDMQENSTDNKARLIFEVPSRGLLGFGPEIATLTRGTAVVNHCFLEDREYAGPMGDGMEKGKLVATETGKASNFALSSVAERGTLFIEPGEMVYAGMVIGESTRPGDMDVNAVKAKALNNMRSTGKEEKVNLPPPKRWTVEELIGYMSDDEVIEVTPQSVRLRKMELDAGARERAARSKKKQQKAQRGNKK
jgi:GTP-binding protein